MESLERDLIETIKYGSKLLTEPGPRNNPKCKANSHIYIAALYNLFESIKVLREFERFGFNLLKNSVNKASGPRLVNDFHEWNFLAEYNDWHSTENELVLSGYVPSI